MPKFALIYQYEPAVTGPAGGEVSDWVTYDKEVRDAGVFVYEAGFHEASTARTVSVRDGATVVDDGVAASSGAIVAGLYIVDVADINAATSWAQKIPTARYGSVDVRPVVEYGD
ncbi:YciI family protein [Streptosporangium subroseum]|uniref:YciI family protein n=1 Tax=Streptosporangium subroseum TaxID=106412 RepID=UPI003435C1AD